MMDSKAATSPSIENYPSTTDEAKKGPIATTTNASANKNLHNSLARPEPTEPPAKATPTPSFNARLLWPDMIRTPTNRWTFTCKEIIDKLGTDPYKSNEIKKSMEICLMYFYTLKKKLNLFDHTYTASCILFFRYWFIYDLSPNLMDSIHISHAILVTACKIMENNRPIDAYVKATAEFLIQSPKIMGRQQGKNMDKLKWEVRDKLVTNEKVIMCSFGFDLDIENPKEMIEEMFSGYYRFNRDYDLPEEFTKVFPKVLQEARNFIVQAVTQPVSLLCDGYSFIALSLIYCGIQYKNKIDKKFMFPKDFFKNRFPVTVTAQRFNELFTDYRILEDNFFDLKSNKGEKLQISVEAIESIIDEESKHSGDDVLQQSDISSFYEYNLIKSGDVKQKLLDHIGTRVEDLIKKTIAESKKRNSPDSVEPPAKRVNI
ncbi:Bur2p NDAI_0E03480 [Naumovozyma dairenensis CBS 421]|uniref:Uncharacterized protein n=1 Tax=Naumovozyma dairenensis (strain ATCC 10597 / BCRC 20456 / CBS 421 / NBRC 0211 / NRRL Y-12639) TaxID=1071378 RepID=G0WBP5_NAUDC|nr:hypothetical protein NDAI_0E03480 [Naumovozyma dairenensis CBS 421]CCD25165.1 hypothetical protein NDAI_0E03480 [Naumovozyma dairenensis CBS 421]